MEESKFKILLIGLAVSIACLVGVYAWKQIDNDAAKAQATTNIAVPVQTIPPCTPIQAKDLKIIAMSSQVVDKNTAVKKADIEGKAASVSLYADKPIDKRLLQNTVAKEAIGNKRVVGVLIDPARLASVNEGDSVDVYSVPTGNDMKTTGAGLVSSANLIAEGAKVLGICDEKGNSLNDNIPISSDVVKSVDKRVPRIVYLLVKPEEVPYLINGAGIDKMALAKKVNPDSPAPQSQQTEEAGQAD